MPYRNTPWVDNGHIVRPHELPIQMDTPAWFAWLETLTTFGYRSRHYRPILTVRREKRRQKTYWYAYSKINAKLHNVYLGKTAQLTLARLERACHRLEEKERQERRFVMTNT